MCLAQRFTGENYNVFVLLGDGEMQEGQVWEAALGAAHHGTSRLIAIVDRNGFQLDGKVDDVLSNEPLDEKWRAFGWEVRSVDGHSYTELTETLSPPPAPGQPLLVIANTINGKVASFLEIVGKCHS